VTDIHNTHKDSLVPGTFIIRHTTLRPSCHPETVGVNQNDVNQKLYSRRKCWVSVIECIQPKGVKPKMRGRNLRSGVNWRWALKQKKKYKKLK